MVFIIKPYIFIIYVVSSDAHMEHSMDCQCGCWSANLQKLDHTPPPPPPPPLLGPCLLGTHMDLSFLHQDHYHP